MKLISYVLTFAVLFPSSLLHAESYVAKNDFEKAILLQATDFMDHSLREGLDPNAPLDSEGHTYLMLAAINGKVESIKKLLEYKAKVDQIDNYGNSAFDIAMAEGKVQAAKLLAKHKANVNIENHALVTPLLFAILENKKDHLHLLHELGADFNKRLGPDRMSPLMAAVASDRGDWVPTLIEYGAKLEQVDKEGRTALHYAAVMNFPSGISELLKAGANINAQDRIGRTPLFLASMSGHLNSVVTLMNWGADRSIKDQNGLDALYVAYLSGEWKTFLPLIMCRTGDYIFPLIGISVGFLISVTTAKALGGFPKVSKIQPKHTGSLKLDHNLADKDKSLGKNRATFSSVGADDCMKTQMNIPNPEKEVQKELLRKERKERKRLETEFAERAEAERKQRQEKYDQELQEKEARKKIAQEKKYTLAHRKREIQESFRQRDAGNIVAWVRAINNQLGSENRNDRLIGYDVESITNQSLEDTDPSILSSVNGLASRLEKQNEDSLTENAQTLRSWLAGDFQRKPQKK